LLALLAARSLLLKHRYCQLFFESPRYIDVFGITTEEIVIQSANSQILASRVAAISFSPVASSLIFLHMASPPYISAPLRRLRFRFRFALCRDAGDTRWLIIICAFFMRCHSLLA
jgi:hypothetical protein